jgi:4-amino-4-deoxy-L-arabinose transferase-like glycosyltransferase
VTASKHYAALVVAVASALIIPQIFREGMFMDGQLYSSVAVNYSRGLGTFWSPHFAKVSMPVFYEQPPLMFFLQGIFFRLFGESMYMERGYSLLVFGLSVILFVRIWRKVLSDSTGLRDKAWLALLVWLIIPNATWVVVNNMEENTMGLFVLLSVLFILHSFEGSAFSTFQYSFLAALALGAGFLTKGFPVLFPLCLPVFFYFFDRDRIPQRKSLLSGVLLLAFTLVLGLLLYLYAPAREFLGTWLQHRVINSIRHATNAESRLDLIWFLLQQLIPVLVLTALLFVVSKLKRVTGERLVPMEKRSAVIFLLLAVAGSFPLIITREQSGFYLATCFPYYAIGFAVLFKPVLSVFEAGYWNSGFTKAVRMVPWITIIAVAIVTVVTLNVPKRDAEKNNDIRLIASTLRWGDLIAVPQEVWNDWQLQTGLIRTNYISLTRDADQTDYLLTDPPEFSTPDTLGYERLDRGLVNYVLYRKKNRTIIQVTESR